jgi:hypothetical protein
MSEVTMLPSAGSLAFLGRIRRPNLSLVISEKGEGYKAEAFDQSNVTSPQLESYLVMDHTHSSRDREKTSKLEFDVILFQKRS